jgi:hypothetical protein
MKVGMKGNLVEREREARNVRRKRRERKWIRK